MTSQIYEELLKKPITWKTDRGLGWFWLESSILRAGEESIAQLKFSQGPRIDAFGKHYRWSDNEWKLTFSTPYQWKIIDDVTKEAVITGEGVDSAMSAARLTDEVQLKTGGAYLIKSGTDDGCVLSLTTANGMVRFLSIRGTHSEYRLKGLISVDWIPPKDDVELLFIAFWSYWFFGRRIYVGGGG